MGSTWPEVEVSMLVHWSNLEHCHIIRTIQLTVITRELGITDRAVKVIKSGDWVDYGWCTNTVDTLDKALAKRTDELKDINLRGGILLKPLAVFDYFYGFVC